MSELPTPELSAQERVRCTEWLERVKLGQLANGGAEWRKDYCECEPETNNCPCQYCAIHEALRIAETLLAPRSNVGTEGRSEAQPSKAANL